MQKILSLVVFISCLFIFAINVQSQQEQQEFTEVIAEGTGTTEPNALNDAFRNAVQQAVGAFVDAKTQVANEKVFEEIRIASHGYIQGHEVIATKKEEGLVRIKIQATVKKRDLAQKLVSKSVISEDIRGNELKFNIENEINNRIFAARKLHDAMKGFPLNCMTVEIVKPDSKIGGVDDMKDGKIPMRFFIRVQADMLAYQVFSEQLCKTLDEIKYSVLEVNVEGRNTAQGAAPRNGQKDEWRLFEPIYSFSGRWDYWSTDSSKMRIAVNVHSNNHNIGQTSWKVYTVDRSCLPLLAIMASTSFQINLEIQDADGRRNIVARMMSTAWDESARPGHLGNSSGGALRRTFVGMVGSDIDQSVRETSDGGRSWGMRTLPRDEALRRSFRPKYDSRTNSTISPMSNIKTVLVGPMFLSSGDYVSSKVFEENIELSLDDIGKIRNTKVSLTPGDSAFDGELYPADPEKWLNELLSK